MKNDWITLLIDHETRDGKSLETLSVRASQVLAVCVDKRRPERCRVMLTQPHNQTDHNGVDLLMTAREVLELIREAEGLAETKIPRPYPERIEGLAVRPLIKKGDAVFLPNLEEVRQPLVELRRERDKDNIAFLHFCQENVDQTLRDQEFEKTIRRSADRENKILTLLEKLGIQ